MKRAGIILAGGLSRRFGEPKAFAEYGGKPFYERACEALEEHVEEIVIVAKPEWKAFTGRKVIYDDEAFRGKGPLAGIYSGMKNVRAEWYGVIACDMPLMDEATIERLFLEAEKESETDAIVPSVGERLQPLAAVYHCRTLKRLESLLKEDKLKVTDFLDLIRISYIQGLDSVHFQNVNTKEDLRRINMEARQ